MMNDSDKETLEVLSRLYSRDPSEEFSVINQLVFNNNVTGSELDTIFSGLDLGRVYINRLKSVATQTVEQSLLIDFNKNVRFANIDLPLEQFYYKKYINYWRSVIREEPLLNLMYESIIYSHFTNELRAFYKDMVGLYTYQALVTSPIIEELKKPLVDS